MDEENTMREKLRLEKEEDLQKLEDLEKQWCYCPYERLVLNQ